MPLRSTRYVGRFAPSPSGPLHMGSLLAALASYLDARAHGGVWLLRIDDIDPPREQRGASDAIIRSLQQHGMQWDGDICWQSQRSARYEQCLQTLRDHGHLFPCSCSRAQLAASGGRHFGPCVAPLKDGDAALRLRAEDGLLSFDDRLQGRQQDDIAAAGDSVLKRRDGLYAYQLATVVDDGDSQVSDVVRGSDLMATTAQQIYLQQKLAIATPRYLHIPVLTASNGQKLSKQQHAPAIDNHQANANLRRCLQLLRQAAPPAELTLPQLLNWATEHWQLGAIPATTALRFAV